MTNEEKRAELVRRWKLICPEKADEWTARLDRMVARNADLGAELMDLALELEVPVEFRA